MISGIQGTSGVMATPGHPKRFKAMDKNGDGTLDKSELAGMAKHTGKSVESLMAELDTNNDGKVDSSEMDAAAAKHRKDMAAQGQISAQSENTDPKSLVSQFTTSLMKILKQLEAGEQGNANATGNTSATGQVKGNGDCDHDGDAKTSAAATDTGNGAKVNPVTVQNSDALAKEFTTGLMNILQQLQNSQKNDGSTDNSKDLVSQFHEETQSQFTFSQTTSSAFDLFQKAA